MKKRFLLVIMAMFFAIGLKAQETSLSDTVAFPNESQGTVPISTNFNYSYSQSIYQSSEVSAGVLSHIDWYLNENNQNATRTINIEIYLAEVPQTSFATNAFVPTSQLTQVYSGPVTLSGTGWFGVDFQVPFVYTGANNLVVGVKASMGSYFFMYFGVGTELPDYSTRSLYTASDYQVVTPENPVSAYSNTRVPSAIFTRLPEGTSVCLPVQDLVFSNTDQTSTTASWSNPNGEGTTFTVSYRLPQGEFVTAGTTSDTTFEITGLTSSTVYEVQVVANCGEDQQAYPTIESFNTACAPVESFPWSEDFATNFVQGSIGGTVPHHCWINVNGGSSTYRWGGLATRSSLMGYFSTSETMANSDWLIFPAMEFTGVEAITFSIDKDNASDRVMFDIYYLDVTNGDVTSEADTTNFTYLATILSDANTPSGETFQVLLSNVENTGRLAFVNKNPNPSFYIPEVTIEEVECPDVYGFSAIVSNVDAIQVNLNTLNHEGSGWVVAYGTADSIQSFNPETASTITINDAAEFPYLIQGLTPGTTYYLSAKQNCDGEFTNPIAVTLPQAGTVAVAPFTQDYNEIGNAPAAQFVNGTINAWVHGTATNNPEGEGGAIYISNDGGTTNAYTTNVVSRNYFTTLVAFPTDGSVAFRISFDWKCYGEGTAYDYLKVYMVPVEYELSHGNEPASRYAITGNLNGSTNWNTTNITLDAAGRLGTMQKLVFMWRNDDSNGNPPPAAIDNLSITSLSCIAPASIAYQRTENPSEMIINITSSNPTETTYLIEYKPVSANEWFPVTTTELTYTLTELELGTEYEYRVAALCDGNMTDYVNGSFVTNCAAVQELPYTNTFSGIFTGTGIGISGPLCWINLSSESNYKWSTTRQEADEASQDGDRYALAYNGDSYGDARPIVSEWIFTPAFEFDGEQRLQFEASLYYNWERPATVDIFALDVSENDLTSRADTANATYLTSVTIEGSAWSEKEVILSNIETTSRLAFAVRHHAPKFFIDNVRINQAPPCPDVHGLTATTPDGSSIVVTFDTLGAQNGWIVAYAPASNSFDPETATQVTIPAGSTFPYTLATNVDGGNYTIAVKQNCDGAYWSYPVNLFIPIVNAIPYAENFDQAAAITEWTVTAPNSAYAGSLNKWCYGTILNNTTDEAGNLTNGGAFYVSNDNGVTNAYNGSGNAISTLSTFLAFEDDLSWELSFDWKGRGEYTFDYMEVYLLPLGESLPTSTYSSYKIGQSKYQQSDEWTSESIILGQEYANSVYQLVFLWYNDNMTATNPPVSVDNISVSVRSCFEISDLTAIATEEADQLQAIISFTDTINQGVNYLLEYKLDSESTWTSVSNITNPYTLTGLQYGSEYDVRVKAVCSETESSMFVSTTFNTPCASLTAPWTEGFEAGIYNSSNCWFYANGELTENTNLEYTDGIWIINGAPIEYNGTNKMYYNLWGSDKHKWIMTPTIDLGDTNTQLYQFSFDIAAHDYSNSNATTFEDDDKIAVVISTDNGLTWSSANAVIFANADADTEHNLSDITRSLSRKTIALQDATGTPLAGRIKIGIYASTLNGSSDLNLFLDNFEVNLAGETSPCIQPSSLLIEEDNITENSAILSWSSNGSESGWEVRVGENGTIENSTIPFYNITGLDDNTTYTVYVRSVCNATNRSEWDSIQFTTLQVIPCEAPINLVASNVTATTAEITWNGAVDTYELRVNAGSIETLTATSKTLTNLNPSASYTVDVRAVCEERTSDWVSVSFITLEATTEPCDAPTNLSASNITQTSAEITWNGTASTYEFKLNGGEAETLTTTTKSLTGLTANTAYTVEVRAICEDQTSDWVTTNFTTLEEVVTPQPCDAPTNLSASNITETSAEITWNGTATTYEFKLNGGEAETLTTTSKTLTGLTANTAYTVEVRSICEDQASDWVSTNFTTIAAPIVIVLGEVTTSPATNVGNTSATLNGALVSAGESENFTVGFALATVADFTLETAEVQNITSTLSESAFTATVNDLAEGQTYFYRAYITNEAGTAYGAVETFTLSGLNDAIAGTISATIYPNPAQDNATMEIVGLDQDAKIVISDLQGRILSQEAISAGETHYTINVSNMASGVYYIRIVTDKAVSTQKLIVE
ncbi:MAG: fibronectin type III domain-containing protein [Bacteroidales bacterium]|nr:fibronectin type III domain-containing protein [Bacteroidales bacterium]